MVFILWMPRNVFFFFFSPSSLTSYLPVAQLLRKAVVASGDVVPFVLGAIDVAFYVSVFWCRPVAGEASCCALTLLDKSFLQELGMRILAFGACPLWALVSTTKTEVVVLCRSCWVLHFPVLNVVGTEACDMSLLRAGGPRASLVDGFIWLNRGYLERLLQGEGRLRFCSFASAVFRPISCPPVLVAEFKKPFPKAASNLVNAARSRWF